MKQIKLTDLVDSVIDCLTEPDGGHAVGNGNVKDAVLELKEIKALFIHVVTQAKRPVCPDCFDRGELRNDKEEIIGTCPCHY